MMKYSGCIIKESLKDKTVLDEFKIIDTNTDSCIVEIDADQIEQIVPRLQKAMVDDNGWYADLKNYDYHYIIYNDRIFKVDRDFGEQYEEAKEYGLKRGISECQLPNASWAK